MVCVCALGWLFLMFESDAGGVVVVEERGDVGSRVFAQQLANQFVVFLKETHRRKLDASHPSCDLKHGLAAMNFVKSFFDEDCPYPDLEGGLPFNIDGVSEKVATKRHYQLFKHLFQIIPSASGYILDALADINMDLDLCTRLRRVSDALVPRKPCCPFGCKL